MANEQVEIHDPFNGHNGFSQSDSENTEDTIEFRLLMAYATRRRPKQAAGSGPDNTTPSDSKTGTPSVHTEKKKKKRKTIVWSRLPKVLVCLRSRTKDDLPSEGEGDKDEGRALFRCAGAQMEKLDDVAARMAEISDEIPFVRPEIEPDSVTSDTDVDVEKVIGLLLREAGDRLNEEELKDTNLSALLGNYSFFENVITSFLKRIGLSSNPETLGPKVSTQTQIAVTCEVTSRLSVLDTLPMNRLLGHGARFLRSHFSSWAEEQGGYENAFPSNEDEEIQ